MQSIPSSQSKSSFGTRNLFEPTDIVAKICEYFPVNRKYAPLPFNTRGYHSSENRGGTYSARGLRVLSSALKDSIDEKFPIHEGLVHLEFNFELSGQFDTHFAFLPLQTQNGLVLEYHNLPYVKLSCPVTGECLHQFASNENKIIKAAVLLPENRVVTIYSDDKDIKVWDCRNGLLLQTWHGHDQPISSVSVSPDGSSFATSSFDKTVKIWSTETLACVCTLVGHTSHVYSVVFLNDGFVATSSFDKSIRLWNIVEGVCVQITGTHRAASIMARHLRFFPERQVLVAYLENKTINCYEVKKITQTEQ